MEKIRLTTATCNITGLPIGQHETWKDVSFNKLFSCGYKILGKKTLVLQGRGFSDLEAETASVEFGNKIVETYMDSPSEYLMIQDWEEYVNSTGKARHHFMKFIVNDLSLIGIIFCNGTRTQEMSVLLGKKLGILNKEIRICHSYNEAAMMALRFEQLGQLPEVTVSLFSRLLTRISFRRKNTYNQPISDLLEYLNSIDWTSGKPRPSGYRIKSDHPLLPIFDALTLIKSKLDRTTHERNQYMSKLLEHQEQLEDELQNRTREIQKKEQYFSRIIENSPVSIALMDKKLQITYINRNGEECFGYSVEDFKRNGMLSPVINRIENIGDFILKEKLEALLPPPCEPGSFGPIEIELFAKDKLKHYTEITFTAIEDGYLVLIVDITDRKIAEEKLFSQSVTDHMTGFYNRRYFQELMEKEFSRSKRYSHPLSLIIFDVDLFKNINDLFGHPAGDSVLRDLADMARKSFRNTDLLFRIGGEEFAVILPETEKELGWMAAERFRSAVADSIYKYENKKISMTISLGISTMTEKIKNVDDLFKQTDEALYRAKENGRNCTEVVL